MWLDCFFFFWLENLWIRLLRILLWEVLFFRKWSIIFFLSWNLLKLFKILKVFFGILRSIWLRVVDWGFKFFLYGFGELFLWMMLWCWLINMMWCRIIFDSFFGFFENSYYWYCCRSCFFVVVCWVFGFFSLCNER